MRYIEVDGVIRQEGSIVVFEGFEVDSPDGMAEYLDPNTRVHIAVDHREAQALINEIDEDVSPIAVIESWQLIGGPQ